MNDLRAGARLQWTIFRRNPGHLLVFITVPFFTAIFVSSVQLTGHTELEPYAVLAPPLMGLWVVCLDLAGVVLASERRQGTLELFLASPGGLTAVLTGRASVIAAAGTATFLESWLVARFGFAVRLTVHHAVELVLTVAAIAIATMGVTTVLAALFVRSRAAHVFTNALGYPFYLLGGVFVPVSHLPGWLRPLSWLTFLYWGADLLRATTVPQPVAWFGLRLAMLLTAGAVTYLAGLVLVRRMLVRLRAEGSVSLS